LRLNSRLYALLRLKFRYWIGYIEGSKLLKKYIENVILPSNSIDELNKNFEKLLQELDSSRIQEALREIHKLLVRELEKSKNRSK